MIFSRIRPAIRPARCCAPRRRHANRFGRRSVLALGVPNTSARRAVRSNAACESPVFVNPAPWSLALRAPAAGTKNTAFASPHNRFHPWRFMARDKSRLNIEHRIIDLRFQICVLLLQTLKQRVILMERPKGATEKSLHGHRLRRESGGTGLPFFDIPEMRFRLQCLQ